jgi:hypothetical protein
MGGVWEDAQMVFPSPSLIVVVRRAEITNPNSITNVVDLVCCGHPIVRNNAGHVRQVVMPRPGDVSTNGRNQSAC